MFLSADETAEIDEADEELVATDLALVGAVPGAIDQIPFSYMDYLEGKGLHVFVNNLLNAKTQALELPSHGYPAQLGSTTTTESILPRISSQRTLISSRHCTASSPHELKKHSLTLTSKKAICLRWTSSASNL